MAVRIILVPVRGDGKARACSITLRCHGLATVIDGALVMRGATQQGIRSHGPAGPVSPLTGTARRLSERKAEEGVAATELRAHLLAAGRPVLPTTGRESRCNEVVKSDRMW